MSLITKLLDKLFVEPHLKKLNREEIERLRDRGNTRVLIAGLKTHPDADMRAAIAWRLDRVGPPSRQDDQRHALVVGQVIEALGDALKDKSPAVRMSAAHSLGCLGGSSAEKWLVTALSDPEVKVRMDAVWGLAKCRSTESFGPLVRMLRDSSEHVRASAACALGELRDLRSVHPLREALQDSSSSVRGDAALALYKLKDRSAVEPLVMALTDPVAEVREKAATSLGLLGDAEGVSALVQALGDPEWTVRRSAASALGNLGDRRAAEALAKALKDPDKDVQWNATKALEKMGIGGGPEAAQPRRTEAEQAGLRLDAIVIVFNRDFPTRAQFVEEILGGLTTRGRTYRTWMQGNTPVRVLIHPDAQDQMTAAALANVEFRKLLGDRVNLAGVQFGTFEGSQGVVGSVLSHWS
ncbi:MAG TPA: HEAT repeat domain-containing protein [Candidatus Acidoferrales bacterium]|nr:HEAT repeat domain-containing protein [Candidatus Acidoferrales bacterium]